jgi:hypothetical protein
MVDYRMGQGLSNLMLSSSVILADVGRGLSPSNLRKLSKNSNTTRKRYSISARLHEYCQAGVKDRGLGTGR